MHFMCSVWSASVSKMMLYIVWIQYSVITSKDIVILHRNTFRFSNEVRVTFNLYIYLLLMNMLTENVCNNRWQERWTRTFCDEELLSVPKIPKHILQSHSEMKHFSKISTNCEIERTRLHVVSWILQEVGEKRITKLFLIKRFSMTNLHFLYTIRLQYQLAQLRNYIWRNWNNKRTSMSTRA